MNDGHPAGPNQLPLGDTKRKIFAVLLLLLSVGVIAIVYLGYILYRTAPLYTYAKTRRVGWSNGIHRADAELGFAPIPNAKGHQTLSLGPDIPVHYDKDGFRVPVSYTHSFPLVSPVLLTLGCSFTYGDANPAEETYPYLAAQMLGGTVKNAGFGSYGLSQMLLLGRKLIPLHKPDYVIFQYSPWLAARAQTPFAIARYGHVPIPFFYEEKDSLALHPPIFLSAAFALPLDRYRSTPRGATDFLSFLFRVGVPLFSYEDAEMALYAGKSFLGAEPRPTGNRERVEWYVYEELARIARANGVKVCIVILGSNSQPVDVLKGVLPADAIIVDAYAALLAQLPERQDIAYRKQYAHWRGSPPVFIDEHPNARAHRLIAEQLVAAIPKRPQSEEPLPSTISPK